MKTYVLDTAQLLTPNFNFALIDCEAIPNPIGSLTLLPVQSRSRKTVFNAFRVTETVRAEGIQCFEGVKELPPGSLILTDENGWYGLTLDQQRRQGLLRAGSNGYFLGFGQGSVNHQRFVQGLTDPAERAAHEADVTYMGAQGWLGPDVSLENLDPD